MNIFQIINSLLFSKKDPEACLEYETNQMFQPYMINRWSSFYSKELTIFINSTLNKYYHIFEDKCDTYKLYYYLIPTLKFKMIQYVKKKKNKESLEGERIEAIANAKEMSIREIRDCVDLYEQLYK